MTQMSSRLLSIDGVDFGVDDGGVGLAFDTLDGWDSGPGSRTAFTARTNGHGDFDAPSYRASRVVTATGLAYAGSDVEVAGVLVRMMGVLAEGDLGQVSVADAAFGDLSIMARLSDGPLVAPASDRNAQWTWQFSVTAPDPRKYAAAVPSPSSLPSSGVGGLQFPLFTGTGKLEFGTPGVSGQVTLANPGNATTWPTYAITGPVLGGVLLTEVPTGRRIVYAGDVPAGALLLLDSASGHAWLNGSLQDGNLTVAQWWSVPKFASTLVQFATLGALGQAGSLVASIRPAYW